MQVVLPVSLPKIPIQGILRRKRKDAQLMAQKKPEQPEKKSFYTPEEVKMFVEANILNAVDNKLLPITFNKLQLEVVEQYEGIKYCIKFEYPSTELKDKMLMPAQTANKSSQLRHIIRATKYIMGAIASSVKKI